MVWITWAAMFASVLGWVLRFGSRVPYWDDWRLVPVLAGGKPLTFAWLWTDANAQRAPVANLLQWALARASGGDLRAGMLGSATMLGALAAVLIRCAARLRGRTSLSDACFPLVMLHLGHSYNLLTAIDLHFACHAAVFVVLLCCVLRGLDAGAGSLPLGLLACALLLPVQSATGLVMAPVFGAWLLYAAGRSADSPRRWLLRATVLGMAALSLAYMLGLRIATVGSSPAGLRSSLQTALQFASTSLGPAGRTLWPLSGLAVAGLTAATAVLLLRTWRARPEQRVRAMGLLAALVAMGTLALAVGVGRSGLGWEAGFGQRYVTSAGLLLCCIQLAWIVYGGPRWSRRVPALLCLSMALLMPHNLRAGYDWAQALQDTKAPFESDLSAGASPEELAERHGPQLSPRQEGLAKKIELMRRTGLGIYKPSQ
ncbi:MAG: hypothetical protein DRQ55_02785 [Planctomycetota bacterium]|nr:MAG: hypothetical protein DRQ55_02785 [Planctomycetota bacterium]